MPCRDSSVKNGTTKKSVSFDTLPHSFIVLNRLCSVALRYVITSTAPISLL